MDIDEVLSQHMILNALEDVGSATLRHLLAFFQEDFVSILTASYDTLCSVPGVSKKAAERIANWRKYFNLEREKEQLITQNVRFLIEENADFPPLLKSIDTPPIGLYAKGQGALGAQKYIAIVGTRKPSVYGLKIAREFALELAKMGFVIGSGMALGIDTAAHEGALASGANDATVAVLGSGIDVIYPRENAPLYRKILEQGTILSEFPFGKKASKVTFPIRNRVLAGMCSHVLVIESDLHGGSMITAHLANDYGHGVMAVPGRIDQPMSRGCHTLIREGATLVAGMDHILEELNCPVSQACFDFAVQDKVESVLEDPVEQKIVAFIHEQNGTSPDALSEALDIPVFRLLPRLQMLELRQVIRRNLQGNYEC
ncbi:MAG: DNA-processing protein DprA [Verrucomicrobiota bacterium]|nr:MAG: DNA-processing protein DprA [Verrucomicrobiota bacterium]